MKVNNGKNKRKRMTFETPEDADLKSFLASTNISTGRRCYFLKLEGDLRFEDVVGPASLENLTRREFVVRLQDVDVLLESSDEKIKSIQKASGATLAIISYPEGRLHYQARLELWGTDDQVKSAEALIVKATTELYPRSRMPTILMQAPFGNTEVYVPLGQVSDLLLGTCYDKVIDIEAKSGAWIRMDSVEVPRLIKRLKIFGSPAQIYRALIMVHKAALKPYISLETKDQESAKLEDENQQYDEVYVPLGQVSASLLGSSFEKVKEVEEESGARIEVDQLEHPGEGHLRMIRLKISGCRAQIYQVLSTVQKATLDPYINDDQESAKLEEKHQESEHVKEAKDTSQVYAPAATKHNENVIFKPISYFGQARNSIQLPKFHAHHHKPGSSNETTIEDRAK